MSQLYIRVMTGFYSHRKTIRLRSKIGNDAYWVPPSLWAYAAENQPDGNMSSYSSEEISMLIGCDKHATSMLQALTDCGFIDSDGMIHDWEEHNGYHKKYSERAKIAADARWKKEKNQKKEGTGNRKEDSGDKHCLEHATSITSSTDSSPETQSTVKQHSFSKPDFASLELYAQKIGLPPTEVNRFQNYYESNGWKVGKNPMKNWQAAMNNWKLNLNKGKSASPKQPYYGHGGRI